MKRRRFLQRVALQALTAGLTGWGSAYASARPEPATAPVLSKRWLFVWRNLTDPKEVDRLIARFPRAQKAGYNGVVFSGNVAPERAPALRGPERQLRRQRPVTRVEVQPPRLPLQRPVRPRAVLHAPQHGVRAGAGGGAREGAHMGAPRGGARTRARVGLR